MDAETVVEWLNTLTLLELRRAVERICREGHALIETIEEWQRPADDVVEIREAPGGCLRLELVKCGKPTCKCAGGHLHGPYWYRYTYKPGGGQRKEYIGKQLP